MDTLKVSKKSWHYRLVNKYTTYGYIDDNICAYMRQVMVGIFVAIMAVVAGVIMLDGIIDPILYLIVSYQVGTSPGELSVMGGVGSMIDCVVLIFVGMFWITDKIVEHRRAARLKRIHAGEFTGSRPGFISQAYRAWKDKMCFKVEVVE